MEKYYIDITKQWTNNHGKSKILKYKKNDTFIYKGNKYRLDNHYVKYMTTKSEMEFAKWLIKRINKNIILFPKIEYPLGIKSPDFKIKNSYYDLKTITGNSKQIIYHRINKLKDQSSNFFFDADNSSLTKEELLNQVNYIFKSTSSDRIWINLIGIKKNNKLIILKRKKQ